MRDEVRSGLEGEVDRIRELTSIGAGHAATAFASLVGGSFSMRVPAVRLLRAEAVASPFVTNIRDDEHRALSGVFFEVEGALEGVVAFLFPTDMRRRLLERVAGRPPEELEREQASSALRELGNILASHVVSAIADTMGAAVVPSVPLLALEDAPTALASLVGHRERERPVLRVETEIAERAGELRGLLVLVPDAALDAWAGPDAA